MDADEINVRITWVQRELRVCFDFDHQITKDTNNTPHENNCCGAKTRGRLVGTDTHQVGTLVETINPVGDSLFVSTQERIFSICQRIFESSGCRSCARGALGPSCAWPLASPIELGLQLVCIFPCAPRISTMSAMLRPNPSLQN